MTNYGISEKRHINDLSAQFKRPISRLEAYIVYNGAPDPEDDPADYFIYPKGVRLA